MRNTCRETNQNFTDQPSNIHEYRKLDHIFMRQKTLGSVNSNRPRRGFGLAAL